MFRKLANHLTDDGKVSFIQVLSWIMYDAANSFFQAGITSLYYGLWIVQDMGAHEYQYGWAISIAQLLLILTGPIIGAMVDRHSRKKIFLIFFTLQAVIATIFLRSGNVLLSLLFFSVAYYAMQVGQIVYDSYILDISTRKTRALVSGYGIASGQVGHIIIILLMMPVVARYGRGATFAPIGILFLIFSLPALLFLKQKNITRKKQPAGIKAHVVQVLTTFKNLKKYPGSLRFFIARFFYNDTLQTVYTFIAIYFSTVFSLSDFEVQAFFAAMLVFAIIASLMSGHIMNKIGSKNLLSIVLGMMIVGFLLLAFFSNKLIVAASGIILGIVQGTIWSADRVVITKLSPDKQLTEFFGIYSIMSRFATILGPLVWGYVIHLFVGYGLVASYRIAMGTTVIFSVAALIVFLPLKIER